MMHHRLAIGGELDNVLDAETATDRGNLRCAAHVLGDASGGIVQPAMGHWPCGQPVRRAHVPLRFQETSKNLRPRPRHRRVAKRHRRWCGHGNPCRRRLRPSNRTRRSALSARLRNRRRIDNAEPDHAHHLVEVAKGGLDLRQQVDGNRARRHCAVRSVVTPAPAHALGDQLALWVSKTCPGRTAGFPERTKPTFATGAWRLMQDHAFCRQFLLDRTAMFRPRLM